MEDDRKDESPASWRLGLRKTGSYGALAEITATKEAQREKDTTGVMRSASSPRLSSSLDNKDKEKVNSHIVTSFFSVVWYVSYTTGSSRCPETYSHTQLVKDIQSHFLSFCKCWDKALRYTYHTTINIEYKKYKMFIIKHLSFTGLLQYACI